MNFGQNSRLGPSPADTVTECADCFATNAEGEEMHDAARGKREGRNPSCRFFIILSSLSSFSFKYAELETHPFCFWDANSLKVHAISDIVTACHMLRSPLYHKPIPMLTKNWNTWPFIKVTNNFIWSQLNVNIIRQVLVSQPIAPELDSTLN